MRQSKNEPATLYDLGEFLRIRQRSRHRLIAYHMNARFQKSLCWRKVQVVRRHNRDYVDAILASFFSVSHFLKTAVTARDM